MSITLTAINFLSNEGKVVDRHAFSKVEEQTARYIGSVRLTISSSSHSHLSVSNYKAEFFSLWVEIRSHGFGTELVIVHWVMNFHNGSVACPCQRWKGRESDIVDVLSVWKTVIVGVWINQGMWRCDGGPFHLVGSLWLVVWTNLNFYSRLIAT